MTVDSNGEAAPVRRSYSMAGWTGRKPKEAREKLVALRLEGEMCESYNNDMIFLCF